MNDILVISDNVEILNQFRRIVADKNLSDTYKFTYACSPGNHLCNTTVDVILDAPKIIENQYMVLSLHCKQVFPKELTSQCRCVNVHPGYNPYNRGMFPHVFSIVNGLPCGATIHEMDSHIDHGQVICQKQVQVQSYDTSLTLYEKIVCAEIELLNVYIEDILRNTYVTYTVDKGNINYKKDFDALCNLNLQHTGTLWNHIKLLRALSHGEYKNAYFIDDHGRKIYIKLQVDEPS